MLPYSFYQEQINELTIKKGEAEKKVRLWAFIRLSIFLIFAAGAYGFWGNHLLFSACCLAGIILFLVAVNYSVDARLILEKTTQHLRIATQEFAALPTKKTGFDHGAEFINPKHAFSTDLDLFSPQGVFSFFNRTSSLLGKKLLAKTLLEGSPNPGAIQEKIELLSKHLVWTQEFRVAGTISSRENAYSKEISGFSSLKFINKPVVRIFAIAIPILAFSTLIAVNLDWISTAVSGLIFTLCAIPIVSNLKETNLWATTISEYEAKIKVILDQIALIKRLNEPSLNTESSFDLNDIEQEIKQWLRISKRFEFRMNFLLSIPLNIFAAWDFQQRLALEKWTAKNSEQLLLWEQFLANFEVLISAATVRFNYRTECSYAQIDTASQHISCEELAHPLIQPDKCVTNNFSLDAAQSFVILTGPNMAGKSTFLRSLGLSIVFANAGFPVFATSIRIPPLVLYSSMRTTDDLSNESSYFHAELSRLKLIKDAIQPGRQIFVLLDEILKGTNSKDKEEGSKKFLSKMKTLGAKGVIATHDLSLCELSKPESGFENYYFDSTISNNELSFDYKIKSGICKNMNASFLLKKMELID